MRLVTCVTRPIPVIVLIVALLAGTSPVSAAGWTAVSSPNASGTSSDFLYGVAPVSSSDIWTVGDAINGTTGIYRTLTEHWNGSGWSVVSSANVSSENNYLGGAAALATNDVWATGFTDNLFGEQTLIEHWNGSAWSIVSSPDPGGTNIGQNNFLGNISAVSSTDIWAVGFYTVGSAHQTLTVHWDGTSWSAVPSPNVNGDSFLNGVTAIAGNDVWASGAYIDAAGAQRTLIEHWNGTAWSVVSSPSLNTDELLVQMAAASSVDVWAAGYSGSSDTTRHTLVEHWNGTSWSVISSPAPGTAYDALNGIAVISTGNVWATGYRDNTGSPRQTLIEHWNGTSWSVVASANKGTGDNTLEGVAIVPGGTAAWTAGFYYNKTSSSSKTLIERHS